MEMGQRVIPGIHHARDGGIFQMDLQVQKPAKETQDLSEACPSIYHTRHNLFYIAKIERDIKKYYQIDVKNTINKAITSCIK